MADHRRLSNSEFVNLLNEIATKADGNAADFGLTQDLIDEAKTRKIGLQAKVSDQIAKRDAAKAATTVVTQTRKSDDQFVSDLKAKMRLEKVSPDKFIEAGFDADDSIQTVIVPQTPTDLVVEGFSNGTNKLKFNRNGNKKNTVFLVDAKIGNAADSVIVGTTTKTTFEHKNQKPGVKVTYRVRAQRGDDLSDYSNPATVYE
ncbi:MAG TPA: hypothetical protein PKY59_15365 [Pyrinomonadaceae bacterium]|nr:hypothetical protein [Pyrinomonadaceae bacterium]